MISSATFAREYARLNAAQKEAVDAIEGPVVVAAGPGTGKTQILALRIANILLKTDTKPENILCLTFTESGVFSMRDRLRGIIGNAAYRVAINTFHGFCNEVIKDRPEDFPRIIGAVNITEADQIAVLEEVFQELPLDKLSTFGDPFYYLRAAQSAIGQLKQEGIGSDLLSAELEKLEAEFWQIDDLYSTKKGYEGKLKTKYQEELKKLEKNKELAKIYAAYEAKLRAKKFYDFTDMVIEVRAALKRDPDLLLFLQESYQYILVDEHQDTNNAQNGILELLASYFEEPNLFVVGDDKQAIYRFQGASLENFLYFKQKYPAAKFIVLEENYRSSQLILDSAHSLLPGEKRLLAQAGHPPVKLRLFELSSAEVEACFVAKQIAERIESGTKPEQIAVIYRDNADAFPLSAALGREGIPFAIESKEDLLEDASIRKLLLILRAVNSYGEGRVLIESLHLDFLDIPSYEIYKFAAAVAASRVNAYEAAGRRHFLEQAGIEQADKFLAWSEKLDRFSKMAVTDDVASVFETVIRESGFLPSLLAQAGNREMIGRVNELFDEVQALIERKKNAKLADFLDYLDRLEAHEIRLKKGGTNLRAGRVRLMTAHGSKGLEFDYVYLTGAVFGHWGNRRRRELVAVPTRVLSLFGKNEAEADENGDERRLFFVALTRAKKEIVISYARRDREGRERLPAVFLGELDPALCEPGDASPYEDFCAANPAWRLAALSSPAAGIKDREFVRELFLSRGFSVTHLNNYLVCPWRYFYMNLLRLPKAPERHLLYGTAVHAALEDFFNQFKENGEPGKEFLLAAFAGALAREPIPAGEYELYKKRGEEALAGYWENYHGRWRENVLTEFDIKGIILPARSPEESEIVLTGKLDKIEFLGAGGEVNVVDYKTGKPKSRNKIEGNGEDESEGSIKRQLAFYKILLDRYDGGRYKMLSGDIDFVEPNERGIYKKENFTVSEREASELEELIRKTAAEIINLDFWDRRCEDKKCEFCALRELMKN